MKGYRAGQDAANEEKSQSAGDLIIGGVFDLVSLPARLMATSQSEEFEMGYEDGYEEEKKR